MFSRLPIAIAVSPVLILSALFVACGTSTEGTTETVQDAASTPVDGSQTASDTGSTATDAATSITTDSALADSSTDSGPPPPFCDPSYGHLFCADFEDTDVAKGFGSPQGGVVTRDTTLSSEQAASARFTADSTIDAGLSGSSATLTTAGATAGLMSIGKRQVTFDVYIPSTFSFPSANQSVVLAQLYFVNGQDVSVNFNVNYRNAGVTLSHVRGSFYEGGDSLNTPLPKNQWITFSLTADGTVSPMPYRFTYRIAGGNEVVVGEGTDSKLMAVANMGTPRTFVRIGPQIFQEDVPAITLNYDRVAVDAK